MTLESTIRKMQVQWIEESIDFDNLIESLDEGIKPKAIPTGRMKAVHALVAKGMSPADIAKKMGMDVKTIEALMDDVELDEAKYDLYHKDFSTAMQHAYKMAKKMYGITVDPEEIDDKVASGPRKPSEGKTNKYRLKGDKGAIQIQVYNKGGSKPFELNMYKEEVELDEAIKDYEVKIKVGSKTYSFGIPAKDELSAAQSILHTIDQCPSVIARSKGGSPGLAAIRKQYPDMKSLKKKGISVSIKEEVKLDERSAAAQARRDARGEFDDKPEKGDDVATDADKKRGDENIINQLRKAADNPKHEVRFADGKSEVVKPDIVKAALEIFMQLKSNDKRKLQPVYAKSAKSLTSIVNRLMKKAHYEGVEEMNEDFRTGRFGVSQSLVDAVKDIIMGKRVNETNKNDKSDDGEGLDAVQPKAVKKKFKDRKDKDIDNDGDVDDSDKFLHKRRKAISKAMDKKESKKIKEQDDDEDEKETAKKAKKDEPKKNGKEKVEVDPTLSEASMKDKLIKTADLIQKMIKPGDPDRHDYAAARDHIEANNMKTLKKIVMKMDTVPKERIAVALAKGLGKAEAEKILGVELNMSEEIELDEKTKWKMGDGRPRGGSHIENERFWDLPKSSLEYIIKDAGEAMRLNPTARKATTGRGNWADQVNDAQTVLGWRRKNGIKEEVKEEMTEAQKEKREEIVKELKKKTEDFKKKYGNRWEDVMYATATKMAMKAA